MNTEQLYHEISKQCLYHSQRQYEAIRPLLFNPDYSLKIRAGETGIAQRTLRKHLKSFKEEGFKGLNDARASPWNKGKTSIPKEIQAVIYELKARSPNMMVSEIQRYLEIEHQIKFNFKTIQKFVFKMDDALLPVQLIEKPDLSYEKKVEAVKLNKKGFSLKTIAQWVGTSVSTVKRALKIFHKEKSFAALEPRHQKALVPARIFNFPNLHQVLKLQRQFPNAGSWRIMGMLQKMGLQWGRTTVSNMMAFNRTHYLAIPEKKKYPAKRRNPTRRHEYWFIDVRYLTEYERKKAYSICILEGYSRKIVAGEVTSRQTLLTILKVMYPAVRDYGLPEKLVSDNAKVFTCRSFIRFLNFLGVTPDPIDQGKPWQNLIESFFGIERRIFDHMSGQAESFEELRFLHNSFLEYYNHSEHYAHQNRLDQRQTPAQVLSWVQGKNVSEGKLNEAFKGLVIERKLTKAGYARIHNFYLYVCIGNQGKSVEISITEKQVKIEMDGEVSVEFECELFWNQELKKVRAPKYLAQIEQQKQLSFFEPEEPIWPSHFKRKRRKHIFKDNRGPEQLKLPFEELEDWEVS